MNRAELNTNDFQTQKQKIQSQKTFNEMNERVFLSELHKSACTREVIFTSRAYGGGGGVALFWELSYFFWQRSHHAGLRALMLLFAIKASALPTAFLPPRTATWNLLPPFLHLFYTTYIHGLCMAPKTSWKYAKNSHLRHALRAFKNNLFKAKHQRKSKVKEVQVAISNEYFVTEFSFFFFLLTDYVEVE